MARKLAFSVLFTLLISARLFAVQSHESHSQIDQYAEQVSELSSRARANVYFTNPQSIFRGVQVNFVNVGAGNLTFSRRDLVTAGRIPLVFARVYDSSGQGSVDFGPGWTLSAAEFITIEDGKAHLFSENGSTIDFVRAGTRFLLERDYPSDYVALGFVDVKTLEATLRTGFVKQFQRIGAAFRLVKVMDRNGNQIRLSYNNGLLQKIENANHSITLIRNPKGRITDAQDDQQRKVRFAYDAQGRLTEADDLGSTAWTYSYTSDGKLRTAKDPLQRLNVSAFFDESGRVRRLQLPSGTIQFNYDPATRSTTVLDRKDLVSRFFQNEDGITTRVVNPLGEETAIGLDQARNVISLVRNGSVIERMDYDKEHRIVARHSVTESETVDRTYSYDPATGLLAGIHSSGGEDQSFAYDSNGNLIKASLPDGAHKYGFSPAGNLTSISTPAITLAFSADPDGLIASMVEGKSWSTSMEYKAGGELASVSFADGTSAKYEFQPSGLRTILRYKDKRHVEYSYDPAGNLNSTRIFDTKGKQSAGQVLTLDDSYQLIKQETFDGKTTKFNYDKNGNLIEIRQDKSLTRFDYDSLNRLISVITPDGQRFTYEYKPGERSIAEEYEHAKPLVLDRRDTGLTFDNAEAILDSRPLTSTFGTVRFSENVGTFQLAGASGKEIITPEQAIEPPLRKLQLFTDGTPLQARQGIFNRPFNPLFMPAEYATINCCPMCIANPERCFNCDPGFTVPVLDAVDPDHASVGDVGVAINLAGTFNDATVNVHVSGTGITVSPANPAVTPGIAGSQATTTFNIANTAAVGSYTVTVSDSGGTSNGKTFSVLPAITDIEPAQGLIGTTTHVTITGMGFGTTPTLNAGVNIAVTNVAVSSGTQITADFAASSASSAGGTQNVTVIVNSKTSEPQGFFIQVPTFFTALSYNAPIISGCASPGIGYFGDLRYQVSDQNRTAIAAAGMTPQENFTVNGTPAFLGFRPFATPQTTPGDGTFDDTPIGSCITTPSPPPPPPVNVCADVVQTFNIVVATASGPVTYPINTQTTRRDCQLGQKVTVSPGSVFTSGTVN